MVWVVLAIAVSTAAGVWADRRLGDRATALTDRLVRLILWVLLPPIAFFVTAHLELTEGVGVGLLLVYAELAIVTTAAYLVATRLLRLGRGATGAVVVTTSLANTGYLGIPLCIAFFGTDSVALAVAYDSLVSAVMLYTVGFGSGAALGTRAGETARQRVRAFFTRNPVLPAVVLGLLAPKELAPDAVVDVAELAAAALLPVGFFLLGVNLTHEAEDGQLRFPPPFSTPVALVVGLRLVAAPILLAAFAAATSVDVPDAYYVLAAMPSGINSLVVAHVFGLDLRLVASALAWSTAAAVLAAIAVSPFV
ncbi:AEC family transporter [Conexibacter sp. SYSU D00693]|uniref:AEC family transporter n=1 Tax=Conexibacter sp. SYSU D00693 TaxID=2812560 RepID=UPI00196AE9E9|nr:AEC family transporter [Conexibacter sp. SYSU D00693]